VTESTLNNTISCDERRRFTRYSQNDGLSVQLHFVRDRDGIDISSLGVRTGRLVDLSTGGAQVQLDWVGNFVGAVAEMRLLSSRPLVLTAEVVRVQRLPGETCTVALAFRDGDSWHKGVIAASRVEEIESLTNYLLDAHGLDQMPERIDGILRIATNPRSSAQQLTSFIANDHTLEKRVLRVAQSPLFMTRAGMVRSLPDAVKVLGYQAVANIAISMTATEPFRGVDGGGCDTSGFWEHALACANFADLIHTMTGGVEGEMFAAGFLHDLGKLLLVYTFQSEYRHLRAKPGQERRVFRTLEQEQLGVTHDQVNGLIVERLELSEGLADAMVNHHSQGTQWGRSAAIVHIADQMCYDFNVTFPNAAPRPEANPWAMRSLGISPDRLPRIREKARGVVEKLQQWNQILPRSKR